MYLLARIPNTNDYELSLDNSTLAEFALCPYRWSIARVLRRVSNANDNATFFGGVVHKCLEHYYATKCTDIDIYTSIFDEAYADRTDICWRNPLLGRSTMQAWLKNPLQVEPFAIERPFKVLQKVIEVGGHTSINGSDLIEGCTEISPYIDKLHVYYTGRIDLVGLYQGQPVIVDHKTTSVFGPSYWDSFVNSSQMIGYLAQAKTFSDLNLNASNIKSAIVHVLANRQSKPFECDFRVFKYTAAQMSAWQEQLHWQIDQIINAILMGSFVTNSHHCSTKFGPCPYLDVCTAQNDNLRAFTLNSSMFRPYSWNPLL